MDIGDLEKNIFEVGCKNIADSHSHLSLSKVGISRFHFFSSDAP